MSDQTVTASTDIGDEPAGRPLPQDPEAGLYEAEVAYLTGVPARTLQDYRLNGGGPAFYYAGRRRAVRYRRKDVLAWRDSRLRASTTDTPRTTARAAR